MKLLDCTLRDGGYYTDWDFDKEIVDMYIETTNHLPIDYLEVGYRNKSSKEYMGKYGYCPVFVLKELRKKSNKKLAVMLNEKSTTKADLGTLLTPICGLVDMIRLAIAPKNFDRAVVLAKAIKKMDFEVGFNTMYMSEWKEFDFISRLRNINGIADLFCMVDSFGSISPKEVTEITQIVKENTTCPIGFHGHNNLELGLINALTAIESEVDFIDATILGMGRGAGNLKMELLLTYLNKHDGLAVDFNALGDVITVFADLQKKYEWGTNLPYMLSGANSLPQKDVMEWVSNRVYSFNSIVRALDNKKEKLDDNAKYPTLKTPQYEAVIIIGGGNNAIQHFEGISAFIQQYPSIALIHATARHAAYYKKLDIPQYYGLVGSEGKRLAHTVGNKNFKGTCVLPPYPRTMGTDVPDFAQADTFELETIQFTEQCLDSCTTLALQAALAMQAKEIFIVGYDGYPGGTLSEKERDLTNENITVFKDFVQSTGKQLKSLTPTLYKELDLVSVYQFV